MLTAALIMTAALQAELRPDLSWMSGYWLACDNGREVSETWSDPRLDLMTGMNVTVRNGRVGFELSRIAPAEATADSPFAYFAQPEGQPVTVFPVIDSAPNRVVFQQSAHDFPQRVIYEREGDVLNARIEGEINGEERSVRWRFRKAELNARCPT
ncbi:MAG: hypothetical protein EON88_25270 [Brevundimonas sp.]|nr:MAG: hypothetical protein EON88_25270 [Brevundimonas sp.]